MPFHYSQTARPLCKPPFLAVLAFIARCCSFDNQHRHQGTGTAQAVEGKPQKTKEKDVDALTFMQTVIMSYVRGMEHGEQTLPTNDLFVYLPVQILPDLVVAMERQGFTPAEVKGGYGYRPKEEGAEDNPLLAVGVRTKEIAHDRYPRMPDTSWAERAYSSGALDPSLGQAFSFPSLLQLRLRIEVPLWRDLATARHPAADLPAEEDSASDATLRSGCQWGLLNHQKLTLRKLLRMRTWQQNPTMLLPRDTDVSA